MESLDSLRYPIGTYQAPQDISAQQIEDWITEIAATPKSLRSAIEGLTSHQLDTPYRPGGWTVRQVVHHVPDSHLNSYIRFKLALTEDEPTIKPYMEDRWAELADYQNTPIETSLTLLTSLHERWVTLLASMQPADFSRSFKHPESGVLNLDQVVGLYAW
ncbi:MAG: metal-dependent hydrolase, partial [Alicyclobacillus sp. RIFOXYA1_FULL_53_8]